MLMMGHSMLIMLTTLMRIDHHIYMVKTLGNLSTVEEDQFAGHHIHGDHHDENPIVLLLAKRMRLQMIRMKIFLLAVNLFSCSSHWQPGFDCRLKYWNIYILKWWNIWISKYWNIEILKYWNIEILKYWLWPAPLVS